jgi:hypothetical protein
MWLPLNKDIRYIGGEMDKYTIVIIAAILMLIYSIRWWFVAKEATYRKYILRAIGFLIISIIIYPIGKYFDIIPLELTGIITFIITSYYGIKATILEHRAKKESLDD